MKIREVRVRAGRLVSHRRFSNFTTELEIIARVEPGEDVMCAVKDLQLGAERAVTEHVSVMLKALGPEEPSSTRKEDS